jgi:ATP:corrinoid adenosyltransferase
MRVPDEAPITPCTLILAAIAVFHPNHKGKLTAAIGDIASTEKIAYQLAVHFLFADKPITTQITA